jgi:hypothetical protein
MGKQGIGLSYLFQSNPLEASSEGENSSYVDKTFFECSPRLAGLRAVSVAADISKERVKSKFSSLPSGTSRSYSKYLLTVKVEQADCPLSEVFSNDNHNDE